MRPQHQNPHQWCLMGETDCRSQSDRLTRLSPGADSDGQNLHIANNTASYPLGGAALSRTREQSAACGRKAA